MSTTCDRSAQPLRYHAMIYSSRAELLDILAARTRGRIGAQDPVLVAVDHESQHGLREMLGDDADAVEFVDPATLSGNTAGRVVRRFVSAARRAAAVGPLSVLVQHPLPEDTAESGEDGSTSDDGDSVAWLRLECEVNATVENIPIDLVHLYDVDSSANAILDNTRGGDGSSTEPADRPGSAATTPEPAPELGAAYDVHLYERGDGSALRGWLYFHAAVAGLTEHTADEFVSAVHEATTAAAAATDVTTAPDTGTPGDPDARRHRVPVRIWPWSQRVTCEVPVPAALAPHDAPPATPDPALDVVRRARETCPNVHVEAYRDDASPGGRVRLSVSRHEPESVARVAGNTEKERENA